MPLTSRKGAAVSAVELTETKDDVAKAECIGDVTVWHHWTRLKDSAESAKQCFPTFGTHSLAFSINTGMLVACYQATAWQGRTWHSQLSAKTSNSSPIPLNLIGPNSLRAWPSFQLDPKPPTPNPEPPEPPQTPPPPPHPNLQTPKLPNSQTPKPQTPEPPNPKP